MKLITSILILVLWFVSPLIQAHGDEDHGAPATTVAIGGAPRVVTHSDLFELVGIVENGMMTIYLDRYADNSPVTGAKIEVEVGSEKGFATASPNGTYQFSAKAFSKPSEIPVTFTIAVGNDADLLAGDLVVVDGLKEDAVRSNNLFSNKWIIGGLITLLFLMLASLWVRNRRHQTVGIFK